MNDRERDQLPQEGRSAGTQPRAATRGRLLRLAISCPECGTRPALRVTEAAAQDVLEHPPDERIGTYQCHRRRCGVIYDLPARAYHQAS